VDSEAFHPSAGKYAKLLAHDQALFVGTLLLVLGTLLVVTVDRRRDP